MMQKQELTQAVTVVPEQDIMKVQEIRRGDKKKTVVIVCLIFLLILLIGAVGYGVYRLSASDGCRNYSVYKEQYAVEYSGQYDYEDVLTVEYPRLEGLDHEIEEQLNSLLYDTAMDRVNYWHLNPDEEVKAFQKEYFSMFCSKVDCDVPFHSQYLLSIDLCEIYDTYLPVWEAKYTERAVNVNLTTGEVYEPTDILTVDKDFIAMWCRKLSEKLGEEFSSEDEALFLRWFLKDDEETGEYYVLNPWFYITEGGEFVVGISLDPKAAAGVFGSMTLQNCTYCVTFTAEELDAYRLEDSSFWKLYEQSEPAGKVVECPDLKEHLWFGENGSVWEYWERIQ